MTLVCNTKEIKMALLFTQILSSNFRKWFMKSAVKKDFFSFKYAYYFSLFIIHVILHLFHQLLTKDKPHYEKICDLYLQKITLPLYICYLFSNGTFLLITEMIIDFSYVLSDHISDGRKVH